MKKIFLLACATVLLISCRTQSIRTNAQKDTTSITTLTFIDEVIIPETTMFQDTKVGGLSGIDFANNSWYVISDDRAAPRFYTYDIPFTLKGFGIPKITELTLLKDTNHSLFEKGKADPESLRVTAISEIIWSSEGNISQGIPPFVRRAAMDGSYLNEISITHRFLIQEDPDKGPINNGVFEALCKNYNSDDFWVATELPLKQDGLPPTSTSANAPVRIASIDKATGTMGKEYAYKLDKVARSGLREVNGVTEILSYDKHSFLVLERSYATGYENGGNDVKIYKVDTTNATDVSTIESLSTADYIAAQKTLLIDFESIRSQLTDGIVDNIEGMTFGPDFENGNRSLVLVSDNNFNAFGKQLTQLILFEVH